MVLGLRPDPAAEDVAGKGLIAMSPASPRGANSSQPIFDFASGLTHSEPIERDILGGKGAGLAEMGQLGVPVPPGFTISTAMCSYYHESPDEYPGLLSAAVDQALTRLEERKTQFKPPPKIRFFHYIQGP